MLTEGASFVKHSSSFGGLRTSKVLVHLNLSIDGKSLEWRNKNDGKNKGFAKLSTLKQVRTEDENIVLLDYNMKRQLVIEPQSSEQRSKWTTALKSIVDDFVSRNEKRSVEEEIEAQAAQAQVDLAAKQKRMQKQMRVSAMAK